MIRASSSCDRPLSRSLHFRPHERDQARSTLTVSKRIATEPREPSGLLNALVDALPEGLMVLSVDRSLIYLNQKARTLCQKLSDTQRYWTGLPFIITSLCDRLVQADTEGNAPAIAECQTTDRQLIRLTARWFNRPSGESVKAAGKDAAPYILVILEDREESLRQDVWVEQQKFCLTKREAEIWSLLKREYSYQAIASTLQISFNTVKTHIRNIQSKRHMQ